MLRRRGGRCCGRRRNRPDSALELAVDDPDVGAEGVQLSREREPGRARADDEHVRFAVCRRWVVHAL